MPVSIFVEKPSYVVLGIRGNALLSTQCSCLWFSSHLFLTSFTVYCFSKLVAQVNRARQVLNVVNFLLCFPKCHMISDLWFRTAVSTCPGFLLIRKAHSLNTTRLCSCSTGENEWAGSHRCSTRRENSKYWIFHELETFQFQEVQWSFTHTDCLLSYQELYYKVNALLGTYESIARNRKPLVSHFSGTWTAKCVCFRLLLSNTGVRISEKFLKWREWEVEMTRNWRLICGITENYGSYTIFKFQIWMQSSPQLSGKSVFNGEKPANFDIRKACDGLFTQM